MFFQLQKPYYLILVSKLIQKINHFLSNNLLLANYLLIAKILKF